MTAQYTWDFNERSLGRMRNPVSSAFFTGDALARELVGEVGQNAHDAAAGPVAPVVIRYTLCESSKALRWGRASEYFGGLWEHLEASVPGYLKAGADCKHLIIEDFGTTGLTGDVAAPDAPSDDEEKNHFYHFFRAENVSGKSGEDGGRWGLGKVVYMMASKIDTYFALTKRAGESPCEALMGVSILKNHSIGGKRFEPDGWFGRHREDGFHLPITDPAFIDQFSAAWNISRRSEPGLSVVVPYPDDSLNLTTLRTYAIRDFFMPVMKGELIFEFVNEDGRIWRISKETIVAEAQDLIQMGHGNGADDDSPSLSEIASYINMLEPTMVEGAAATVQSKPLQASAAASEMFTDEAVGMLRELLEAGETVNIQVNLEVRQKGQRPAGSHFNVILRAEDRFAGAPLFVRGKLVVTKAKTTPISGYRCIVNVQHRVLSSFLGDAENPAHEEWLLNTKGLTDKYMRAAELLRLVRNAPWRILSAIRHLDENETRPVFPSFFSILDPESTRPARTPNGKGRRRGGTTPDTPGGGGQSRVASTEEYAAPDGGFGVRLTPAGIERGVKKVQVRVAYARLDGKSLQFWEPADFDLMNLPASVDGGQIAGKQGKELLAIVEDPDCFDIRVSGFDVNRDLHVESRGYV